MPPKQTERCCICDGSGREGKEENRWKFEVTKNNCDTAWYKSLCAYATDKGIVFNCENNKVPIGSLLCFVCYHQWYTPALYRLKPSYPAPVHSIFQYPADVQYKKQEEPPPNCLDKRKKSKARRKAPSASSAAAAQDDPAFLQRMREKLKANSIPPASSSSSSTGPTPPPALSQPVVLHPFSSEFMFHQELALKRIGQNTPQALERICVDAAIAPLRNDPDGAIARAEAQKAVQRSQLEQALERPREQPRKRVSIDISKNGAEAVHERERKQEMNGDEMEERITAKPRRAPIVAASTFSAPSAASSSSSSSSAALVGSIPPAPNQISKPKRKETVEDALKDELAGEQRGEQTKEKKKKKEKKKDEAKDKPKEKSEPKKKKKKTKEAEKPQDKAKETQKSKPDVIEIFDSDDEDNTEEDVDHVSDQEENPAANMDEATFGDDMEEDDGPLPIAQPAAEEINSDENRYHDEEEYEFSKNGVDNDNDQLTPANRAQTRIYSDELDEDEGPSEPISGTILNAINRNSKPPNNNSSEVIEISDDEE